MKRRSLLSIGILATATLGASGAYYQLLGQGSTSKGSLSNGSDLSATAETLLGFPVGQAPYEVTLTPEKWKERLTRTQFLILREHRTERPFSSPLDKLWEKGTYHCAGCDLPVYSSETKYDSGTGWPSFWAPLPDAIRVAADNKLWAPRVEVHCRRCGGHFGHVFRDGPQPTGLRHCLNGEALNFRAA